LSGDGPGRCEHEDYCRRARQGTVGKLCDGLESCRQTADWKWILRKSKRAWVGCEEETISFAEQDRCQRSGALFGRAAAL
jgi:hypothetical protein